MMTGRTIQAAVGIAKLALAGSAWGQGRVRGEHCGTAQPSPRVWSPQGYQIVQREVIIPAEYRTIVREVWVEPVYEYRTRDVWVPDCGPDKRLHIRVGDFSLGVGVRDRHCGGHYERVTEQVLVLAGHYETITEQVLVRPQQVQVVRERVLIDPGRRLGPRPAHRAVGYSQPAFRGGVNRRGGR